MVDINSLVKAAEGQFKKRILESGFHDKESASNFIEAMGQCFREITGNCIRRALEEERKSPAEQRPSGQEGGYCKGKEWYESSDPFPFGKYGPKRQGLSFSEIPSKYYEWLIQQEWIDEWPGIVRYINGEEAEGNENQEKDEAPF